MTRNQMIRAAEALGFQAAPTRTGHLRLTHPSGALVHAAGTPSDVRSYRNTRADLRRELRRHGVMVEERDLSDRPAPRTRAKPSVRRQQEAASRSPRHLLDTFMEVACGVLQGTVSGRPAELRRRVDALGARWELRWLAE